MVEKRLIDDLRDGTIWVVSFVFSWFYDCNDRDFLDSGCWMMGWA